MTRVSIERQNEERKRQKVKVKKGERKMHNVITRRFTTLNRGLT